jgi:hypothetical protein
MENRQEKPVVGAWYVVDLKKSQDWNWLGIKPASYKTEYFGSPSSTHINMQVRDVGTTLSHCWVFKHNGEIRKYWTLQHSDWPGMKVRRLLPPKQVENRTREEELIDETIGRTRRTSFEYSEDVPF